MCLANYRSLQSIELSSTANLRSNAIDEVTEPSDTNGDRLYRLRRSRRRQCDAAQQIRRRRSSAQSLNPRSLDTDQERSARAWALTERSSNTFHAPYSIWHPESARKRGKREFKIPLTSRQLSFRSLLQLVYTYSGPGKDSCRWPVCWSERRCKQPCSVCTSRNQRLVLQESWFIRSLLVSTSSSTPFERRAA